jgi:Concanavalin A-like lectin/glucanases superfamily
LKHCWILLVLTAISTTAIAQTPTMDLFCNAGLRPNGYIDFTGLPPAPNFPSGEGSAAPSAPVTATLPVAGVPGLTVQVTIPALQGMQPGPTYTVSNGTLVLNGVPSTSGELLTLQFSTNIAGIGLIANSVGRQSDFTLQTDAPGLNPPNFANGADTLTIAPKFYSIPLQQVDLQAGFKTAYLLYTGGADFGNPSIANIRVQASGASFTSKVPTQGLQQWLISQSVQSPFTGDASSWPDQSGNNHNATQTVAANEPAQIQGDGNACQPAFYFGGNQFFTFNLPIDSWQQMTVFLVAKSLVDPASQAFASQAAAIFWEENATWGNTFVSPYQASVPFRFGTTQAGNEPIYSRPSTIGQDFTVTRAEHNGDTDSLYVDGQLALCQGSKLPALGGTTGVGYLGKGLGDTYFKGEISEVLVYNRVLSPQEAASVEFYLRNKFGTR